MELEGNEEEGTERRSKMEAGEGERGGEEKKGRRRRKGEGREVGRMVRS